MNGKLEVRSLFIVRHTNDFDFLAPIAWRLALNGHVVRMIVMDRTIWKRGLVFKALGNAPIDVQSINTCSDVDAVFAFFRDLEPDVVIFDWCNPAAFGSEGSPHTLSSIMKVARLKGIPTLSLPHGLALYDESDPHPMKFYNEFDAVVVESADRRSYYQSCHVDRTRLRVVGSARHSGPWLERLAAVAEPSDPIELFFLLPPFWYPYARKQLVSILTGVARIGLRVVVQPHPRDRSTAETCELFQTPIEIDADTHSFELIKSSATVSTLTSSAVVDAFLLGKPVLYLKTLHENRPNFANTDLVYIPSKLHDPKKLWESLIAYRSDSACMDLYLSRHVFGTKQRDVLDQYLELLGDMSHSLSPATD